MLEPLQVWIRRLLKVPPEPEPPLGDPASVRIFRAAPGFLRYRLLDWGVKQLGTLIGLAVGFYFVRSGESFVEGGPEQVLRWIPWSWIARLEYLAIVGFVVQLVYSLLLVLLDYRYRWYVITDRSLRIREGIWKVQERTMTFSNVQNVTVRQGPVQRAFGIADLRVQTAGGGGKMGEGGEEGSTEQLHVGYFRGVANAAEIRDAVLARLRRLRSSGLGDPEEPERLEIAATDRADPPLLEAAREVLDETRFLARALRRP